ncbi:MAG: hypothetical protein JXX29_04355 [Deltaproteobacteria bacterium]|nr:hypothetical protein [Deltaproteobacteria bacterium]MBN2670876.1 hypothetical protein [Deltaproteobacteria bacterium]
MRYKWLMRFLPILFWVGCHDSSVIYSGNEDFATDSGDTDSIMVIQPRRPEHQTIDSDSTASSDSATDDTANDTDTTEHPTWTMMMYMDADSNLEADMLIDLEEVSRVNTSDWLNILVLFDRHAQYDVSDGNWTGTRLFKVNPAVAGGLERLSEPLYLELTNTGDNEEKDMGDPATLDEFVYFSMSQFPADHYALVLSGHGNGWSKKGGEDAPPDPKFICSDDSGTSNGISIQGELAPLLANRGIDVLGFDACLMGMVEVAWAVKDSVSYVIASEGNEASYGWDYLTWLSRWMAGSATPRTLAEEQVAAYRYFHEEWNLEPWLMTMAAVETAKLDALGEAIDAFVANYDVSAYVHQAMTFDDYYDYYYDLMDIAELSGDAQLKEAIQNAVISSWNSDYAEVPGGLSIFYMNGSVYEYQQTRFCQELDWC